MLRAIKRMREVSKAHGKEVLLCIEKMELKLDEPRHKQREQHLMVSNIREHPSTVTQNI